MVAGGDTETGDVVVDDRPDGGITVVWYGAQTIYRQSGCDRQGQEGYPLDVPDQVLPRYRGQVLLLLNGVGDVVVGDICVGRGEGGLDFWKECVTTS